MPTLEQILNETDNIIRIFDTCKLQPVTIFLKDT